MDFSVVTALHQSGQKSAEWIVVNLSHQMNPKVALQDQKQDESYRSFFSPQFSCSTEKLMQLCDF